MCIYIYICRCAIKSPSEANQNTTLISVRVCGPDFVALGADLVVNGPFRHQWVVCRVALWDISAKNKACAPRERILLLKIQKCLKLLVCPKKHYPKGVGRPSF